MVTHCIPVVALFSTPRRGHNQSHYRNAVSNHIISSRVNPKTIPSVDKITTTMDAILAGLGAAISFAALHIVHDQILAPQGLSCLCPPLGAVAVLLFCLPGAPASQPKAVIGGHVVAGLIGYAVVESGVAYGEAVAVACTITAMSALGVVHPPAGAYAFLFVNKGMGGDFSSGSGGWDCSRGGSEVY